MAEMGGLEATGIDYNRSCKIFFTSALIFVVEYIRGGPQHNQL